MQDLFVKLYMRRSDLAEIEQLRPWLTKSLYRLFVDQYRREIRSPIRLVDDESASIEPAARQSAQPEAQISQLQQQRAIYAALDRLPDDHRALIILCDIEGYSIPEAQQVLDIPGGTAKSRLHRARARLRELLKNQI